MKKRFLLWTLGLITILLIAACAPVVEEQSVVTPPALDPTSTVSLVTTPTPEIVVLVPTQAAEVLPVATSRGPNLEATNPATVNLASGQLHLVEFFRFT